MRQRQIQLVRQGEARADRKAARGTSVLDKGHGWEIGSAKLEDRAYDCLLLGSATKGAAQSQYKSSLQD